MAYIGKTPVNGFHSKQTLSTDGSTTTFTLDFTIADETSIIVSVGGVLQEPKVAYNLSGGGTSIVFTAAPAATDTAYIQFLGQAIVQNLLDASGAEVILDADNDTSLTADTDDQIDIKIAGADDFQFTANKFSILTGSSQSFADSAKGLFGTGDDLEIYHDGTNSLIANKTGALKIATETSGIAVTIGHTTSETTVADNLTVTGTLTVGGAVNFGDFDISNVGSIALDTITNDGTDITLDSSNDIVIDAAGGNIEFKDAGTLQLSLDMDGTAGVQIIQLGVDSDDLVFNQYDGSEVMRIADDRAVYFFDKGGEKISSDGTDFTFNSGNDINLTATTDINIPSNVGLTFGNDAEKIEGDGTDLTIAGNNINLTATADVNIPSGVGLTFATAEKIESDGTDLSITVGSNGDINIPANIGLTFGDDGEKIEGDGTDLTISGNNINLTATADVVIPANVGITFGTGEKIEGDSTDLTVTSGAKINLTATSDIHIPNDVGIVFGGDSEKIEGDGTDLVISANNLTIDAAADIILDAAGNDFQFKAGGTHVLSVVNSSSDVIIKPIVDAKDLIFQQRDGTEVARIEDNATFNVVTGKLAINGTAITSTAAELNILDGVTSTAAELNFSDLATLGTTAASKVFTADANNLTTVSGAVLNAEATLSDGANIAWDVIASPVAKVVLGGNRNLSAPSGTTPAAGQFVSILVIQDGTGSRTLTFNAVYEFTGDVAPTLTTTVNKGDLFVFRYNGAKWLESGRNLNLTLS
jgi:hypothetical protein